MVFPPFFNLSLNLAIRSSCSEPQSIPGLVFVDCIDKKAFLTNQCKEIEENNRLGKTSDLFKKIRDTKGTFHAKMA